MIDPGCLLLGRGGTGLLNFCFFTLWRALCVHRKPCGTIILKHQRDEMKRTDKP